MNMASNNINSNFDSGYTYGGYNDQNQFGGFPRQDQQYGAYPPQPGQAFGAGNYSSQGYVHQPVSSSYNGQYEDNKGGNPPPYSVNVGADNTGRYSISSESNKQDDPFEALNNFSDKAVRTGFIQKVYAILMCQLLVTAGIVSAIMFIQPVKE